MGRRRILYAVISIIIIIVALILAMNYKFNQPSEKGNNQNELIFGKNFISNVVEEGHSMTFNIFGVQKATEQDSLSADLIHYIELGNPQLEIIDYDVSLGESYKGYRFFNILTEIQVKGDDIEEANNLLIQFKDNKKETYDIGKIMLKNDKEYTEDHIQPKGDYTVGYSDFSLDVNLVSSQNVSVKKIADFTGSFFYGFSEYIEMTKDVPIYLSVPSFKMAEEDFDFYTITPILDYKVDQKEYLYNMPSVLYGIMDSEIEIIKKIIGENE